LNKDFKNELFLLIIDKIFFGIAIVIISIGFSYYIQMKFSETERLKQVLQSASNLNSDLVALLRIDITEAMENYITAIKNLEFTGKISEDVLNKLSKLTEDIVNSVNQIDILYEDFSKEKSVDSFVKTLTGLSMKLDPKIKYNSGEIETELKKVRDAYIKLLIQIGNVSIKLAEKDYYNVSNYLGNSSNGNWFWKLVCN